MLKTPIEERKLNTEQKKAVLFGEGPLMIIAGAGTGKTTVVTERIKHLIASGKALPQEILALTFTEKASREMEERVDMAVAYGVTQMWISTFHAFCDRILRNEAINIGIDSGYKLMTEADTILFFKKNLFRFDLQYFRPLGNPSKFISGMLQHFNRLRDEDVTPQQYFKWINSNKQSASRRTKSKQIQKFKKTNEENDIEEIEKYKELANAFRMYEELKVKEGVCDYADLIATTLKLFRTRPAILSRYRKQFKYMLIDEFQDTNYAQNQLAILLTGPKKNITVVGDDDQAIYRWRGAAVSNMIQFKKTFPKTTIIVLTKNYRSTKEILDRSYTLIQKNNPDRLEVAAKIEKKLESMRRVNGEPIGLLYEERVENEAEEVAMAIKGKAERVKGEDNTYEWRDFAILVRANNHAEPFVRALSRAGIPYQFLGPGQLYRQPEVKDLIAYLKVLYNFEDNVAMYRVLSMDWLDLPPRDVAVISNYAKRFGISLFEACELLAVDTGQNFLDPLLATDHLSTDHDAAKLGKRSSKILSDIPARFPKPFITDGSVKKITILVSMVHKHLGLMKKETAGQILYFFLEETGILKKLAEYKTAKDEKVAANISRFFNKLKTFEADHEDASVFAVVDWIELSMSLGESPLATDSDWSQNNAVNIMTIHSAKGLEFPVVFMVNLVSARFPTIERKDQIPISDALIKEILPTGDFHEEEERRLFYVAMTRARDMLYFTGAQYYGEGKREKKLSLYIQETLGDNFVIPTPRQADVVDNGQLTFLDWKPNDVKTKAEQKQIRQTISYISYSQLSAFTTCPLQYKYRYIVKIPVPPSAALTFGDTIHRTVRAFYELAKKGKKPTEDTLLHLLEDHWLSMGFGDKKYEAKMKLHGIELLKQFYEKGYDPNVIPTALEEPFRIKITPRLTLGGKIDRIDTLSDGTLEIIDYKTGQAPKTRDPAKDKQLTVYALSASTGGMFHTPPKKVIVSFYFFEGQQKMSGTRTKEELEKARIEIAQTAETMEKSDFLPTPGRHCDFCEFRLICEAWS